MFHLEAVSHPFPNFSEEQWENVAPEAMELVQSLLEPDLANRLSVGGKVRLKGGNSVCAFSRWPPHWHIPG